MTSSPILSDLILKVVDCVVEPSAKTYDCCPMKSASLTVLVRFNVEKTSAGMLTSDAPLSKSRSRKLLSRMNRL